jgi:hypothetical protein
LDAKIRSLSYELLANRFDTSAGALNAVEARWQKAE